MSIQQRVGRLEAQARAGEGKTVAVRLVDEHYEPLPAEEAERKLAEAREAAGPGGQVIPVEYVKDWPPGGI